MHVTFLSIGTFINPYNIPQAKDVKKKNRSHFFAFHVRCSFNVVICDLNFSKDHGKFALEINTLSCGYQIWCFFCFTFIFHGVHSALVVICSVDLFKKTTKKQTKTQSLSFSHTHTHSVKRLPFVHAANVAQKEEVIPIQSNHSQWLDET